MKKLISIALVLTLVLGLCACGSLGSKEDVGLKVGYAKVNITPELGIGLDGYGDTAFRKADNLIDYLYTTCIAVSSGEDTVLLITFDSVSAGPKAQQAIRSELVSALGVKDENIFIGATHTHTAPSKSEGGYQTVLNSGCVEAAKKAIEDQAPATMLAAKPEFPGMNFVRHYQNDDGTYCGSNFGTYGNLVGHATETDPNGVLIKFDRAEDKKDILMVNWQAHPDDSREIGYTSIAAGWVGPLRDRLESLCGMEVAYFTGASGNQSKDSRIEAEAHGLGWREYGEKMADLINEALPQLQPVNGTAIKTGRAIVEVDINHEWDHMVGEATEVNQLWKSTGDKETSTRLAYTYGFSSVYQAGAILTRAAKGKSEQMEINVFSIGELGFTTGTYEMFSDAGLFVKQNSPFETTFLISGNSSYIPTEKAYREYRCYESDTSQYAPGTAEKLADKYVEMLNALKQ